MSKLKAKLRAAGKAADKLRAEKKKEAAERRKEKAR